MMNFIVPILTLVTLALATPNFGQWSPPGYGDVRSPCPALNAMANHKFIPHDGRGLTIPILVKGLGEGLNFSAETATSLAMIGLAVSSDPTHASFNLNDLSAHNKVEHDGSLSRRDFDLGGDATKFSPKTFNETLSYYKGASEVGVQEIAAARWGRIESSKKENPKMVYGQQQWFPSYFESVAYWALFRDAKTMKASVEWIKIFFRKCYGRFGREQANGDTRGAYAVQRGLASD